MLNQTQENPFVINTPVSIVYKPGEVVIEKNVIGVAISGGKAGTTIAVALAGIVELSAINTLAFSFGEPIYWNKTDSEVTTVITQNGFLGTCALAKDASTAVAQVLLNTTHKDLESSVSYTFAAGIFTATINPNQNIPVLGILETDIISTSLDNLGTTTISIISSRITTTGIIVTLSGTPPVSPLPPAAPIIWKIHYQVQRLQ